MILFSGACEVRLLRLYSTSQDLGRTIVHDSTSGALNMVDEYSSQRLAISSYLQIIVGRFPKQVHNFADMDFAIVDRSTTTVTVPGSDFGQVLLSPENL